jgi:hypothetical protein
MAIAEINLTTGKNLAIAAGSLPGICLRPQVSPDAGSLAVTQLFAASDLLKGQIQLI